MPQEFQVLQCYKCETFQVQQVKKVTKWQCKLCGEKQSVKKVYGRGSGKDCRCHVQQLNTRRGELQTTLSSIQTYNDDNNVRLNEDCVETWTHHNQTSQQSHCSENNKWGIFVDDDDKQDANDDDDGDDNMYTTDATVFKKGKKRKRFNMNEDEPLSKQHTRHHSWTEPNRTSSFSKPRSNRYADENNPVKMSRTWNEYSEEPVDSLDASDQQYGVYESVKNSSNLSNLHEKGYKVNTCTSARKSNALTNDSPCSTSKWGSYIQPVDHSELVETDYGVNTSSGVRKSNSLVNATSSSTSKWSSYIKPVNISELVESDGESADDSYHNMNMFKPNSELTLTTNDDVTPYYTQQNVKQCDTKPSHDLNSLNNAENVNVVTLDLNEHLNQTDNVATLDNKENSDQGVSKRVKNKFVSHPDVKKSKWSSFLNSGDKASLTFGEKSGLDQNTHRSQSTIFSTGALSEEDFIL